MYSNEKDVSDEVQLKNKQSNPFGWEQGELWHDGKCIGSISCGDVVLNSEEYRFTLTAEENNVERLLIYKRI